MAARSAAPLWASCAGFAALLSRSCSPSAMGSAARLRERSPHSLGGPPWVPPIPSVATPAEPASLSHAGRPDPPRRGRRVLRSGAGAPCATPFPSPVGPPTGPGISPSPIFQRSLRPSYGPHPALANPSAPASTSIFHRHHCESSAARTTRSRLLGPRHFPPALRRAARVLSAAFSCDIPPHPSIGELHPARPRTFLPGS